MLVAYRIFPIWDCVTKALKIWNTRTTHCHTHGLWDIRDLGLRHDVLKYKTLAPHITILMANGIFPIWDYVMNELKRITQPITPIHMANRVFPIWEITWTGPKVHPIIILMANVKFPIWDGTNVLKYETLAQLITILMANVKFPTWDGTNVLNI